MEKNHIKSIRSTPCLISKRIHIDDSFSINEKKLRRTSKRLNSFTVEAVNVIQGGYVQKCIELFKRIYSTRIHNIRLMKKESIILDDLMKNYGLSGRGVKYIIWRKNKLALSIVPLIISLIIKIISLRRESDIGAFSEELQKYLPFVTEKIAKIHFKFFFYLWVIQNILSLLTLFTTVACVCLGLFYWPIYHVSRGLVRKAYLISLTIPFLAYLVLPFRQSVNFQAFQSSICIEQLDSLSLNISTLISEKSELICQESPSEWIPSIERLIETDQRQINPSTGTCEAAQKQYRKTHKHISSKNSNSTNLEEFCGLQSICGHCFTIDSPCVSLASVVLYSNIGKNKCTDCYEPHELFNGASCMNMCQDYYVPRALSTSREICLPMITGDQLKTFSQLSSQLEYSQYIVGSFIGFTVIQILCPASISLMLGSIKGSIIAKILSSWSRLPGYGLGASIILGTPLIFSILIALNQVLGDFWSMIAIIAFIFSIWIWYPYCNYNEENLELWRKKNNKSRKYENRENIILNPDAYERVIEEISKRNRLSLKAKVLSLAFLIAFLLESEFGLIIQSQVEQLLSKNQSKLEIFVQASEALGYFLLDVWSKSFLSAVVFGDIWVDICVNITSGDIRDDSMVKTSREESATSLKTLFINKADNTSDEWDNTDTKIISSQFH